MIHRFARRHCWMFLVAAITVSLAGCTGCNRQDSDKDVMAKVNGYKILRAEVDKIYNSQIAASPQKLTAAEEEAARLQILRSIIDVQLHLQKAEKLGVVAPEDEVEDKLKQANAPYTQKEFEQKLQSLGFTEDEYKQQLRHNITIEKLLNKEFGSKITISDSDIQNYYDEHKAEFNRIEPQYYLAHIFINAQPANPSQAARPESDAQGKAQMIFNRLESGEDFANLAAKYSDDPDTARNGGELAPAPESTLKSLDPPTWEAIQKLRAGQYSNILPVVNPQTHQKLGYNIFKLIHRESQGQKELSDVQQWIRNQLHGQREQLLRAAYDEALHDNAQIHNYYAEQIVKNLGQK